MHIFSRGYIIPEAKHQIRMKALYMIPGHPAVILQRSSPQEQIVASAPPPSTLVLHPSTPTPFPHSLDTSPTPSNLPTVVRQLL